MQRRNKNLLAEVQGAPASALAAEIYVDDEWLEAVLENLALAQLSKAQCIALVDQLEALERSKPDASAPPYPSCEFGRTLLSAYRSVAPRMVVGGEFSTEFNEYGMRSPASLSGANVCDSIEHAVRQLQSLGQLAAVRQIVFFLSSNLDEVIADADDE